MPRTEIPTFRPFGLEAVPEEADWFSWRDRVTDVRTQVNLLCEFGDAQHPPEYYQQLELELCAQDPARWIAFWLWIEEPRLLRDESPIKPFVPFAFQVELTQWFVEKTALGTRYDGFISKSRGLGATWIFCAAATWAFLFRPWRGTLISRKEDLVDKKGDLNSMFGKIDFILDHLPEWMLPEGFNPDQHRQKNFLKHPTQKNVQIVGEATTSKSTRGGRGTYIIYDEAAFIPDWKTVFGTGHGTSLHRWPLSSESFEEGDDWWDMWHEAKERDPGSVRELDWPLNPYFDDEWYETEKASWSHDPEGFACEYERNPFTGGGWIYPEVRAIKHFEDRHYDPSEVLLVGIDPGRADDTAIVFMQYYGDDLPRKCCWIDSYSQNGKTAEYYAHILTGIEPVPGDPMYYANFDEYATRQIMPWMRSLPWSGVMRVFCDPSGDQKSIASGKSFTDIIVLESKRLRQNYRQRLLEEGKADEANKLNPVPIVPLYEELFKANRHDQRRSALKTLIMSSSFADTRGGRKLKYALENYHFQKPTGNTVSQPSPLHDVHSHLASAAEYVATYCSLGLGKIKPKRDRDKRVTIDPLTGQKHITR